MYVIDGYNLLYKSNLETRDELIEKINRFCRFYNKSALIVFDGFAPEDYSSNKVEVRFAGDADAAIKQIIKKGNPSQYVLVTEDKDLIYWAHQSNIEVIKSNQFNYLIPNFEKVSKEEDPYLALNEEQAQGELKKFNYFHDNEI